MKSIAVGVPADTVAPAILEREAEMARLDVKLRAPRRVPPDMARLKAALEQRRKQWKRDLRAAPQVARLVLRRLVSGLQTAAESWPAEPAQWSAGLFRMDLPVPARAVAAEVFAAASSPEPVVAA